MTAATQAAGRQTAVAERPAPNGADLLDPAVERTAALIDATAGAYARAIGSCEGHMRRALLMARGIERLRQAITPDVMGLVMQLMNSPNGFMTDRPSKGDPTPYPAEVVKEAFITALLNGFYPVGNEFNVIAKRFYGAQNGYLRKLRDVPGISDIDVVPGVPTQHNGQTVVRVAVSWALDGRKDQLLGTDGKPGRVFAVVAHGGSGPDQLVGKAVRKALKAAYEKATGSRHTLEEPADEPEVPAEEESQEPETDASEGPRSEVERLVKEHGLWRTAKAAVEHLAAAGVPEARVLATLGLRARKELTVEHLVTLKQHLDALAGGEDPDALFPPGGGADAETRAEAEAIAAEGRK
jgi:hypothetical protein